MTQVFTYSPWITVAFFSWFLAQALKMLISTLTTKRWDFSRLVDTGGMPSSHTALVAGLSTSVGWTEGWHSAVFAATMSFSMIVIYDATNLRRSAGRQAQLLNKIVPAMLKGKLLEETFAFRELRELLGHSPLEVFVGVLVGVGVAIGFFNLFDM